jgi:hypothetical protein
MSERPAPHRPAQDTADVRQHQCWARAPEPDLGQDCPRSICEHRHWHAAGDQLVEDLDHGLVGADAGDHLAATGWDDAREGVSVVHRPVEVLKPLPRGDGSTSSLMTS